MTPDAHDLIRALAKRLTAPSLPALFTDDLAIRLFVDVAHGGGCPSCGGRRWRPCDDHHVLCPGCGRLSAFRGSALQGRRLQVKHLLTAVFCIFVDTTATSARGFSRRHRLRLETCWRLLHDVRSALPRAAAQQPCLIAPVLGGSSTANAANALLSLDGAWLIALEGDDAAPPGRGRQDLPLWLGRLRGWLTEVFRGVSAQHLWRYLAEFASRHGRVARGGASHM